MTRLRSASPTGVQLELPLRPLLPPVPSGEGPMSAPALWGDARRATRAAARDHVTQTVVVLAVVGFWLLIACAAA